jgi:recombination protein RecT
MPNPAALSKMPVVQLIKDSASEFAKRLPSTIDATRWVMQLATAIHKNPDLLECEPRSLLLAAYEAADLGVSLSPALQLGYLIPYKGRAQFQISWRGLVQRAYLTGCIKAFFAEVVFANDQFERQYAPKRNLFHAPAEGDRGEAIGAYALVEFKDGTIDWEFCDRALINRHRRHSRQPDSLMWRDFHEEAWRKTAIRILAKRLPLSSPGMEALAEVIERDAQADAEPEPSGKLELEPESVLLSSTPAERAPQIAPGARQKDNTKVFFEVGEKLTVVSGQTLHIKDDLPKLGAKWDSEARVWHMPAARTDELVAVCQARQVCAVEVGAGKPEETESKMLWPREEVKRARAGDES